MILQICYVLLVPLDSFSFLWTSALKFLEITFSLHMQILKVVLNWASLGVQVEASYFAGPDDVNCQP